MGENRIDPYQIVGFLILIACAFWVFYYAPQPAENINDDNQNKIESNDGKVVSELDGPVLQKKDTDLIINEEIFTLENEDIILKISNKGGRIIESILKKYFDQNNEPIKINDNNQNIYIVSDQNPSSFDTSNLFFDNVLTSDSDGTKLKFTHYSSNQANVELTYFLPKSGYLFDFKIQTGNLNHTDIRLKWDLESLRYSRSATYENR